jgi:GST-like protein
LAPFPSVKRWFTAIDWRPAITRRAVGKDPEFKKVNDEKTKRAPFPPNYPATDS